jgi:hypothetical protein
MDPAKIEKAALALQKAWAITYRNAPGSAEDAAAFLAWLERHRAGADSPAGRFLNDSGEAEHELAAVSSCSEHATMRWYLVSEGTVACDAEGRLFLIPPEAFETMPEVEADLTALDQENNGPYEYLT